jgi:hypothetical protein
MLRPTPFGRLPYLPSTSAYRDQDEPCDSLAQVCQDVSLLIGRLCQSYNLCHLGHVMTARHILLDPCYELNITLAMGRAYTPRYHPRVRIISYILGINSTDAFSRVKICRL